MFEVPSSHSVATSYKVIAIYLGDRLVKVFSSRYHRWYDTGMTLITRLCILSTFLNPGIVIIGSIYEILHKYKKIMNERKQYILSSLNRFRF